MSTVVSNYINVEIGDYAKGRKIIKLEEMKAFRIR
jgi:hypothetical protein